MFKGGRGGEEEHGRPELREERIRGMSTLVPKVPRRQDHRWLCCPVAFLSHMKLIPSHPSPPIDSPLCTAKLDVLLAPF